MQQFAHHNETHSLGMREIIVFGVIILVAILVIKFVGAVK